MISYEPLWQTMAKKKKTKYELIYYWGISSNTFRRMSHNKPINTTTMNQLCLILDCSVQEIIKFVPAEEEVNTLRQQQQEIACRRKQLHTNKQIP